MQQNINYSQWLCKNNFCFRSGSKNYNPTGARNMKFCMKANKKLYMPLLFVSQQL
jgi:hypothetical protein